MTIFSRRKFSCLLGSTALAVGAWRRLIADDSCPRFSDLSSQDTWVNLDNKTVLCWVDGMQGLGRANIAWYLNKSLDVNQYLRKAQIVANDVQVLATWYFEEPTDKTPFFAPYMLAYNLDFSWASKISFNIELIIAQESQTFSRTINFEELKKNNWLGINLPKKLLQDPDLAKALANPVSSQFNLPTCLVADASLDNCLYDESLGTDSPNCSSAIRLSPILKDLRGCQGLPGTNSKADNDQNLKCLPIELTARLPAHFPNVVIDQLSERNFSVRMNISHADIAKNHYIKYAWLSDPVGRMLGLSQRAYSGEKTFNMTIKAFDLSKDLSIWGLDANQIADIRSCPFIRVFIADTYDGIFMSQISLR